MPELPASLPTRVTPPSAAPPTVAVAPEPPATASPAQPPSVAAASGSGRSPSGGNQAPPAEEQGDRTLRGHVFLFPTGQQSAFVTTYFGVRQEVLYKTIPNFPLLQSKVNLALVGVNESVDLGIKLLDWLGIFGTFRGTEQVGVDTNTLISQGGEYSLGGGGGMLVRLLRIPFTGTQVAARATVGYASGKALNIYPLTVAVYDAVRQGELTSLITLENALLANIGQYVLVPARTTSYGLHLHAAQTLTPNFGFQFSIGSIHEATTLERFTGTDNKYLTQQSQSWLFNLAFALVADGSPNGVPVAVMLEYTILKGSRTTLDLGVGLSTPAVKEFDVGLYYTGRPNLQAGLGLSWVLRQDPVVAPDGRLSDMPSQLGAAFILRYVW